MRSLKSSQALAIGVVAVAAFNSLAAISFPVRDRKPEWPVVLLWLALLLAHAALYWFGVRLRERYGLRAYVAAQTTLIFAIGAAGALFPVGLALLIAFTAEVVVLAGARWGTIPITLGAVMVYVANSLIASDLYRAATAGLLLTITGVITHAGAALLRREPALLGGGRATGAVTITPVATELTPREAEVLRALASGRRSSQIAAELGISERTVKSHLARIYQKLGVESRAGAVAAAVQRRLIGHL